MYSIDMFSYSQLPRCKTTNSTDMLTAFKVNPISPTLPRRATDPMLNVTEVLYCADSSAVDYCLKICADPGVR
jgi:hypothetical protein